MHDLTRRIVVTLAEVACILGTLVGMGVFGTRVEESSGGALAADATLLAPLGPAFSIWSVIYLGLFAYTVVQWLPSRAQDPRFRATGALAAISMLLNAAWLLVTQQGWLWASVAVIVALVITLGVLVKRLTPPPNTLDALVIDGTFGLYLGWVAVATCANITATLVASGVDLGRTANQAAAAIVIAVAVGVIALILRQTGRRLAVVLASAWGLVWIAVGRLTDQPASTFVGWFAAAAALVLFLLWIRTKEVAR